MSEAGQLERLVDSLVSRIGFTRLRLWKDVLFHPTATFEQEMGKASLSRGAIDVFIALLAFTFILAGLIVLVYTGLLLVLSELVAFAATGQFNVVQFLLTLVELAVVGIAASAIASIVFSALGVVSWLVLTGIEFVLARLLGGTGAFTPHAYLYAITLAAYYVFSLPLFILLLLPCIGIVFEIIALFFYIYILYLWYKAVRIVHGLGKWPAIVVVLLPIVLMILAVVAIYAFLIASLIVLRAS